MLYQFLWKQKTSLTILFDFIVTDEKTTSSLLWYVSGDLSAAGSPCTWQKGQCFQIEGRP